VYSGFGGQVDFIRGASRARNGRAVIALLSTAKDDTVSRITVSLDPAAGVVTSRADVHYVVTEFGVADLFGKTLRERASALIGIAHPRFRPELTEGARKRRLL
jgi:acyl-CoA hydrolase